MLSSQQKYFQIRTLHLFGITVRILSFVQCVEERLARGFDHLLVILTCLNQIRETVSHCATDVPAIVN